MIVVIGILAAITIVAYNGVQQRARDTQRISDLSNVSKAIKLYNVDKGNYIETGSGCGSDGNGNGWLSYQNTTNYLKPTISCLTDEGYLPRDLRDPSGCTANFGAQCATTSAYMKYTCSSGTFLYAKLESLKITSDEAYSAAGPQCLILSTMKTYKLNYILKVE